MAETEKSERKAIRDEKGRFVKGGAPVSPGRPAVAREFREWCREVMSTEGRERLLACIRDPKHRYHWHALELIANYAYGKPTQPISGDDEMPALRIIIGERASDAPESR